MMFSDDWNVAVNQALADTQPQIFVPVCPLCDFLGVDWSGQLRRINNDPVLSQANRQVEINTAGGKQSMQCVPLDFLNGWVRLFTRTLIAVKQLQVVSNTCKGNKVSIRRKDGVNKASL
jgi:hypothetical protein